MLRMHMTKAEKDLIEVHKTAQRIYPAWQCNCCQQTYPRELGNPMFDVFQAPKGIRMNVKQAAATYVICENCQKLPDAEITKGVLSGFLQQKLASVVV